MKLFIRNLLVFFIGLSVVITATIYFLIQSNTAVYQLLYKYQLRKSHSAIPYGNLFIGDSSLGSAIDSSEFTRLSGQATLNCALTGLYGYAGSYNMLKAVHKKHPELRNIILMQTVDMQLREVSMAGYVRTTNFFSDVTELSFSDLKNFISESASYIESIEPFKKASIDTLISHDYIRQHPNANNFKKSEPFLVEDINPEKNKFLKKIQEYCLKNNLNLLYIHGPLYEAKVNESQQFILAVNSRIRETGITLIPEVVKIKEAHLGNSIDHVHPKFKLIYTRMYYSLLESKLVK